MLFPPTRTCSPQPLHQALWVPPAQTHISVWGFPASLHQSTCSRAILLPLSTTLLLSRYLLWSETALVFTYLSFSFIPVSSSTGDGFLFLDHFPLPTRSSINTCWVVGWKYLSSSSSKLPNILSRAGQMAATLQHGGRWHSSLHVKTFKIAEWPSGLPKQKKV